MRQRLALARAFSVEPKIILMDEPFATVDALTREKLQDELLRLLDESSTAGGTGGSPITVILVTHDTQEAWKFSYPIVLFRLCRFYYAAPEGAHNTLVPLAGNLQYPAQIPSANTPGYSVHIPGGTILLSGSSPYCSFAILISLRVPKEPIVLYAMIS